MSLFVESVVVTVAVTYDYMLHVKITPFVEPVDYVADSAVVVAAVNVQVSVSVPVFVPVPVSVHVLFPVHDAPEKH